MIVGAVDGKREHSPVNSEEALSNKFAPIENPKITSPLPHRNCQIVLLGLLFIVGLLVAVVLWLMFFSQKADNFLNLKPVGYSAKSKYQPRATVIPMTLTPTPTIYCPPITSIPERVYKLEIRKKPEMSEQRLFRVGNMQFHLEKLLGIPRLQCLSSGSELYLRTLRYDNRESLDKASVYNRNVYTLSRISLDTEKIYEDEFFTVKVRNADQGVKPYLQNESYKYCRMNEDCEVRTAFCPGRTEPYNHYVPYMPVYGCEMWPGVYDERSDCYFEIIHKSPRCENNKCVGDKQLGKCVYCGFDAEDTKGLCVKATPPASFKDSVYGDPQGH